MYSYLASAYSAPPDLLPAQASLWRADRYCEVRAAVAHLSMMGEVIYSPILHFHDTAFHHSLPTDASYWRVHNRAMIYAAKELLILRNTGWEQSKGVKGEREIAEELGRPICYVELLDRGVRRVFL